MSVSDYVFLQFVLIMQEMLSYCEKKDNCFWYKVQYCIYRK